VVAAVVEGAVVVAGRVVWGWDVGAVTGAVSPGELDERVTS
jgi:hypothetical protein